MQTFDARLNAILNLVISYNRWFNLSLFIPLGLEIGEYQHLITGFTAKESVVSTLTVLLAGNTSSLSTLFTPFTAFVFLIFTLLYTPCVAAIACIKRELGSKKAALGIVLMQCCIAWFISFVIHTIGTLLGFA